MDLMSVQSEYHNKPFMEDGRLNVMLRKGWRLEKALVWNTATEKFYSFQILNEPIIGVRVDRKNKKSEYDFNTEDLLADDWVCINESNLKELK